MYIALEAVLLKLHAKLPPGWALIRVNFDPIQENGPKVGGGRSFVRLYGILPVWASLYNCMVSIMEGK